MINKIVGRWRSDTSDSETQRNFGDVTLDFFKDGRLIYTIIEENEKFSMMILTYLIEGDVLISNQPSSPKEERTRFKFSSEGNLVLDYGGNVAIYNKVSDIPQQVPSPWLRKWRMHKLRRKISEFFGL